MPFKRIAATLLLCLLALAGGPARAETLQTRYSISILGVTVGRADFTTEFAGSRYSVSGNLRSAGLGALVSSTQGTSSSDGQVRADRVQSNRYALNYTSDGKSWSSTVRMRGGRVVGTEVSPPQRKTHPSDYVPVTPGQLANVVDPLASMMIKARADRVCNRTLPIFDGWSRLDLKLSPGGTAEFEADGFSGKAMVCNARIEPVGGFRRSSSGLQYLMGQTIRIWFAPIGDSGIHAPVYVRIPTKIGPLTLNASTFARS
ncbi:DUF3108 domain-containing protein [Aureimonas altamirensis]|uniref:DUF3108 domain-containing protein n=1 Tax=Aureimonas altamirensis TaxID=370622 RepID=UPI0020372A79|nr:DUF3108 domain-containing protein [Aureimonas altamirensis]MCM2502552.1 DUF3108 domain-containing protein [Aureimonas altamirensis]